MSKQRQKTPASPPPAYPEKTTGSVVAADFRKQANEWSEAERARLFEQGMQIIYGGSGTPAAKVRS